MPLHLVPADQRPAFPEHYVPEADGLAALGGRLSPDLIVEAYRKGLFPWTGAPPIPWFSPDPRLVLFPRDVHVGRTVAKTLRRGTFTVRYDTARCTGAAWPTASRPGRTASSAGGCTASRWGAPSSASRWSRRSAAPRRWRS